MAHHLKCSHSHGVRNKCAVAADDAERGLTFHYENDVKVEEQRKKYWNNIKVALSNLSLLNKYKQVIAGFPGAV